MGYPSGLCRFNINAAIPGGDTIVNTVWLRFDQPAAAGAFDLQVLTDRVRDKWAEFIVGGTGLPAASASYFASSTVWTKVAGYKVNNLGHATSQAESIFAANVKGTAATTLPPQVACAVTLVTARPGRSGRGRIFLGGFGANANRADGRIEDAARTALLAGVAGFYTRLRDQANVGDAYRPVVVSPTLSDSFKIKSVNIGHVWDTQRNRRNTLTETKSSAVVDAS